ncbi:MAG: class I SAM-dependent methyltransferase [Betaproteobacteria bacterium]|nr:class I SAM-dependent methyltransferase [Betaproteobacteria bacterium]
MPLAARTVLALLKRLDRGRLEVRLPDARVLRFGGHDTGAPPACMHVHDWSVFANVLRRGDIGFAEGFFRGQWSTSDLPGLLKLLLANRLAVERALHGSAWGTLFSRIRHLFNRNSRSGSRHNIHKHYDIGNAFYELWLDPGMTYSSALFSAPGQSLHAAQDAKLERVLRQLDLPAGSRVLEIGCGWGSFAEAAARSGLRVDGLTLSTEQLGYAQHRLQTAGLAEQVRLELRDYRDVGAIAPTGGYDGIASIEMFEAVGETYWPIFFKTVASQLKPGGRACIQTITISEAIFPQYRRGTDFIQQYIFPGGMLPSKTAFAEQARRVGLEVVDTRAFGQDYATTLALWRERYLAQLDAVHGQGFDKRFTLLWEFYLAYCEAGFAQQTIDVVQFTLRHIRSA